jgi:hypothetical protein
MQSLPGPQTHNCGYLITDKANQSCTDKYPQICHDLRMNQPVHGFNTGNTGTNEDCCDDKVSY